MAAVPSNALLASTAASARTSSPSPLFSATLPSSVSIRSPARPARLVSSPAAPPLRPTRAAVSVSTPVGGADVAAAAAAAAAGPKPTVLVSEKLGEAGLEVLRGFANVECAYNLSPEELKAKICLCDALIVRSGTKVTREVFEAAKGRLKVVGRAGVGIDNVDLQAATEFGCLVVNAPTANTVAAAEHGIALIAAMARNVAQADASMKAGELTLPPLSHLVLLYPLRSLLMLCLLCDIDYSSVYRGLER